MAMYLPGTYDNADEDDVIGLLTDTSAVRELPLVATHPTCLGFWPVLGGSASVVRAFLLGFRFRSPPTISRPSPWVPVTIAHRFIPRRRASRVMKYPGCEARSRWARAPLGAGLSHTAHSSMVTTINAEDELEGVRVDSGLAADPRVNRRRPARRGCHHRGHGVVLTLEANEAGNPHPSRPPRQMVAYVLRTAHEETDLCSALPPFFAFLRKSCQPGARSSPGDS
jgi:hypothetical protein